MFQFHEPTNILQRIYWGIRKLFMCQKELLGYRCKHGIHTGANGGFVRECDGKRVSQ